MHTHAETIVQNFISKRLSVIHAARRQLLSATVDAVMKGHLLSLSRLARGLLEHSTQKAALKRVDRLIGSRRIGEEARAVGAALLGTLCGGSEPLVIAVDWSEVAPGGAFVELRAVATRLGMGRGLTVYQQVYAQSKLNNPAAEQALLAQLHDWMPRGAEVIVITDAGFHRPWFAQVERLGWSWIGRVRTGVRVSRDQMHWYCPRVWFAKANGKAVRFGDCWLTRRFRFACDMVLYRRSIKRTQHYARIGHGSTPKAGREARASAREPWLLAHSKALRTLRPDEIVALYCQRMQIEENFRDSKAPALGMGLELSQSRSAMRIHALLLVGTLAAFLLWHIGQLAEAEGWQRRFKATTRSTREFSIVTLAKLLCAMQSGLPLTHLALQTLNKRLGIQP